jgi:orotidine-5'-phosphate decarboxylase
MPPPLNFSDRLAHAIGEKGNPCCVGLDPRLADIPAVFWEETSGAVSNDAKLASRAITRFNHLVIDAIAQLVPVVKPQAAFYENQGSLGVECLADTIAYARSKGLLVVADAKRADIGSTAAEYAVSLFRALDADCATIIHYFGSDGVDPFIEWAREKGKGLYVVVLTSNPSAAQTQYLVLDDGRKYYEAVADLVADWGSSLVGGQSGYSAIGAVVGATRPDEAKKLRTRVPTTPFLLPGYGYQGATADDVVMGFDSHGKGAIVNASRSIVTVKQRLATCEECAEIIAENTRRMVADITSALRSRRERPVDESA